MNDHPWQAAIFVAWRFEDRLELVEKLEAPTQQEVEANARRRLEELDGERMRKHGQEWFIYHCHRAFIESHRA
jgi:hypothetical protein